MGSGASKTHEAFPVTPVAGGAAAAPLSSGDTAVEHWASTHHQVVQDGMVGIGDADNYNEFVAAVEASQQALGQSGLPPQIATNAQDQLHATAQQWLATVPHDVLATLAQDQGLEHAELVSPKAAAAWLDPSVDNQAKHKIQKLAQQHHDDQVAAGTVTVLAPSDVPDGCWEATPAELLEAQSTFTLAYAYASTSTDAASFEAAVAAETKLAKAHCPQAPDEAAAAAAAAATGVDKLAHLQPAAASAWVKDQQDNGTIPAEALSRLSVAEATQMARSSTSPADHAMLQSTYDVRCGHVETTTTALAGMTAMHPGGDLTAPPSLTSAPDVTAYTTAMSDHHAANAAILTWNVPGKVAQPQHPPHIAGPELAAKFRAGAKQVPIAQLRKAAVDAGLESQLATAATRAQVQNYLLAPVAGGAAEQAKIVAALKAKGQPAPAVSVSGSVVPAAVSPTKPRTAGSGDWAAKHRQLIASLQHHSATLADLPARPDPAQVAGWAFGAGPAISLGGAHTKSIHTAPDGSHWMFKPDKHGGARATADVTANSILHRVGIPTVPVYQRTLGSQPGTVQPLVTGATQLTAKPEQWSQADVDAMVRYHAAAWVVGDHDAKHDNLLRTPGGGLVPIDHGQAFKFFGRDSLSSSFHPNSSYGAQEPVWNTLYRAAKHGKLGPGVTVRPAAAIPVIKAFEAIPDTEYAAMISPTAKAGASNPNIHWRSAMADRAKANGNAKPSADQIADQFVQHAVERKRSLRADFTTFFTTENLHGADVLKKVA